MTTDPRLALALVIAACSLDHGSFLPSDSHASTEIVQACALTRDRCSRCHSIERVANARISGREAWRAYVERMRLMPSSGIPASEVQAITDCLVFRSTPRVATTGGGP